MQQLIFKHFPAKLWVTTGIPESRANGRFSDEQLKRMINHLLQGRGMLTLEDGIYVRLITLTLTQILTQTQPQQYP